MSNRAARQPDRHRRGRGTGWWRAGLCAAACALLAACGGDSGDGFVQVGQVRLVNAIGDSPRLEVTTALGSLGSVAHGETGGFISVQAGRQLLDVVHTPPGGTVTGVIDDTPVLIGAGVLTTAILHGSMAAPRVSLLDVPAVAIADGKVEVQFFNGSDTERIDFFFTAPSADIATATPVASLAVGGGSEITVVDAGSYRLRVTTAGTRTVIYDSGTLLLPAQRRRLFVALEHFGRAGEPLRVAGIDGGLVAGSGAETLGSRMRVANLLADVAAIDVFLGPPAGVPAFDGVTGDAFSERVDLAAGEVAFTATVDGDPGSVLASGSVQVVAGDTVTLAFTGTQAGGIRRQVFRDLVRPISTLPQLQLLHGARATPSVNVYVLAPGTAVTDVTPVTVLALAPLTRVDLELVAGDRDVVVTTTASPPVEIHRLPLTTTAGSISQLTLVDAPGGGTPASLHLVEQVSP
jgi:hypothetical protein